MPAPLGLQALQRRLDHLAASPSAPEVVPDGRIAVASVGEAVGPVRGEAGVVDEPGASERRERLFHRAGATAARASRSASRVRERSRCRSARPGNRERLGAPELPAQEAQRAAVERTPFHEPGTHDHVHRQRAPRRVVQLDGNAAATGRRAAG